MVTIHHLRIGRSIFTVWLMEELGIQYELKEYLRDPNTMRSQADLKVIHPLGKSPVIEDDGLVLAESGAITTYFLEKFDPKHKFSPRREDIKAWATYSQWLHYSEGSVFAPLLIQLLLMRDDAPSAVLSGFSQAEINLHLDNIAAQLGENEFILGEQISGADFGISYAVSMANRLGKLEGHPTLQAYISRNMARPAFKAALKRAVE
ncbi:MAG: glutathione S-transferase [Gammaproteobacteria bacterium]|jgi:glutathione S-transferase